jgi:NADPH-dependent 2,4-dienoyl-CoA reductase/sulfur reductase-like enzyme/pSer/pThr/pTyr-binding forkhead associated (FHA) protein
MRGKRYFIVGDGAAGTTAAQCLRQADENASITIASDEAHPAYYRAALTNYLLGELRDEQLWATTPNFYSDFRIERVLSRVVRIDPARKEVWLSQGTSEPYDDLLIASGSRARPPPFAHQTRYGVLTFRTLADARRIVHYLSTGRVRQAVMVGAGPLGLEWALGLHMRGVRVSVVIREDQLLANVLDRVASDLLIARLKQAGVQIFQRAEVKALTAEKDGWVSGVSLSTGESIPCQLVGVAIGVIPNTESLRDSGLAFGRTGAIVVDARMRTSLPNVYAAGDVAEFGGQCLGLWEPAQRQARVAATNMIGARKEYHPGAHYNATRLFDLDFASVGHVGDTNTTESLVDFPRGTGRIAYRKLVFQGEHLVGAVMLGHPEERVRENGRLFKRIIDDRVNVQKVKTELLRRDFDLHAWLEKDALVRPVSSRATGQVEAANAEVRGTRMLRTSDVPALPVEPTAAPPPAKLLGTRLLTEFNLRPPTHAEGAPAAAPGTTSAAPAGSPEERPSDGAVLESSGKAFPLDARLVVIGRDPSSQIVLNHPDVDLVHAHVQRFGTGHYLRDLGSRTGTWLNGEALVVPHKLEGGDTVVIGNTTFVYRGSRSVPAQPKAARQTSFAAAARLVVRSGHSIGVSFTLATNPTLIGSNPSCGVFLQDPTVAEQHAELRNGGSGWEIRDFGGPGGTWIGGRPLAPGQSVKLGEGDALQIGDVRLVYTHSLTERAATRAVPSVSDAAAARARPSVPNAPAGPRVRVQSGARAGQTIVLGEQLVVGRRPDACQLLFDEADIAPLHLELRRHEGATFARDLGSNGRTAVSGRALGGQYVRLSSGDWLTLGAKVVLVYEESP